MRIRMLRPQQGDVDGVDLACFRAGLTYDVAPTLGTYLVTVNAAEPLGSDEPASLTPLSDPHVQVFGAKVRAFSNGLEYSSHGARAKPSSVT